MWEACEGSNRTCVRPVDGVGECSVCGRMLAVYKDETVVRHKKG